MNKAVIVLTGFMLAGTPAAFPHHSAAAEYEADIIVLQATVARVDWMNPHVWISLDVAGGSGPVTRWECEGGSPNGLVGNGWRKGSLKAGDKVAVECSKAKDRPNVCKIRTVTLADGTRLLMGSSAARP